MVYQPTTILRASNYLSQPLNLSVKNIATDLIILRQEFPRYAVTILPLFMQFFPFIKNVTLKCSYVEACKWVTQALNY